MKLSTILFIVVCFFSSLTLNAQSDLKMANKHYESFEFSKAIVLYKKILKKPKKSKKYRQAVIKLADCYRSVSKFDKAEKWYDKAVNLNKKNAAIKFDYAQVLMSLSKYDQAKQMFTDYAKIYPRDSRPQRMIEWCDNIESLYADSTHYKVSNIPINSKQSDFSPTFYKNGIVFTTGRPTGSRDKIDGWTGETYLDLYYSKFDRTDNELVWEDETELPGWSSSKFNDGPVTFTGDGQTMYFTRNVKKLFKKKNGGATLRIFKSELKNGRWSNPSPVKFGKKKVAGSMAHPTVTSDGFKMYFSSNINGGEGGNDIYVSNKSGKNWSAPVNLGPKINTEGNEVFPNVHPDGTLYFASDSHGGFGGLDVFQTKQFNAAWAKPKNVGYLVNTAADDFGLILSPKKDFGFISSNRKNGKGRDDIYKVQISLEQIEELDEPLEVIIEEPIVVKSNAKLETVSFRDVSNNNSVSLKKNKNDNKKFYVAGVIVDYNSKKTVSDIKIELLELNTKKKFFEFSDKIGNYYFVLKEDHKYVVLVKDKEGRVQDFREVNVEGYSKGYTFHTILEYNIPKTKVDKTNEKYLEKYGDFFLPNNKPEIKFHISTDAVRDTFQELGSPNVGNPILDAPIKNDIKTEEGTRGGKIIYRDPPPISDNIYRVLEDAPSELKTVEYRPYEEPIVENVEYKVQIGSFERNLSPHHSYLKNVKNEYIVERSPDGKNRYMIGSATTLTEAESIVRYCKQNGYPTAFIAIYVNGKRSEYGVDKAPSKWLIR